MLLLLIGKPLFLSHFLISCLQYFENNLSLSPSWLAKGVFLQVFKTKESMLMASWIFIQNVSKSSQAWFFVFLLHFMQRSLNMSLKLFIHNHTASQTKDWQWLIATHRWIQTSLLSWRYLSHLWNSVVTEIVYFHGLHSNKTFLHTKTTGSRFFSILYFKEKNVFIPCFVLVASTL